MKAIDIFLLLNLIITYLAQRLNTVIRSLSVEIAHFVSNQLEGEFANLLKLPAYVLK